MRGEERLVRQPVLRVGAFVRAATNRLGTGKVVCFDQDSVEVEYFHSTAQSTRKLAPLSRVELVRLPPQTRCYFRENSHWVAGRIGRFDGEQYEVDLPNGRAQYLPETILHVRTNLPIEDPTDVLAIKAHETAFFHAPRTEYLRNIFDQSAACRGLTGVLSARIKLLPHQLQVVRRVVEDPVQRYLLADEVGLGKTIEAGAILRQFLIDNPGGRVLVLVPELLSDQWEQELDEKFDYSALDGEVKIVSHESVELLAEEGQFGMMLVDEAQHLAGLAFAQESIKRRIFLKLAKVAFETPRLLLLSATPVLHNEREFLAMLHLLSPELYPLDSVDLFRLRMERRQEIGRVLIGLRPDRPAFLLKAQIEKLRQILPSDQVLSARLALVEHVIDDEAESPSRKKAIREVRAHIGEAYRLHRRMLRNRRTSVEGDLLKPRWDEGAGSPFVEEWDSDERSELVQDTVERWRLAAREFLHIAEEGDKLESGLRSVFGLLLEASTTDLLFFACAIQARLGGRADSLLQRELINAETLWSVPLFEGERKLLREMSAVASRASEVDRTDDLLQMIRHLRSRGSARKIVVFTGYFSVCKRILERMRSAHGFSATCAYHEELERDEIEDSLIAFGDPTSSSDVLVCDRAGEEGRNLQFADVLIHFDLPWNPNRLEQRIGRLDRIGRTKPFRSRVFVGPDVEGSLAEAWYCTLRDGFDIFRQSIASLQMFVDVVMPELLDAAWRGGAPSLIAYVPELKRKIAEELERVAEQDILDEVESLEQDASRWIADLEKLDNETASIQKTTESWIVGALRFHKRWMDDKHDICQYRPSIHTTQVPFDFVYADFAHVLVESATYRRDTAVLHPGTQLLRAGAIFIDKMTEFVRWDDRGQAFAFWRKVPAWVAGRLWMGFVFHFIVEPDLREARAVAREMYDMSDAAALRRQAQGWLPPTIQKVIVDGHGDVVNDPELQGLLQASYLKVTHGGTDLNLTGSRVSAIDGLIDPERWSETCHVARDSAETVMRGRSDHLDRLRASHARAQEEWTQRLSTLQARAAYSRKEGASEAYVTLDLGIEQQVGAAILRGIATPRIRVDSVGFVVLSGRDCPGESL
ncbi:MAG: protein DpdE [Candidatus Acidiferrales bacterium]